MYQREFSAAALTAAQQLLHGAFDLHTHTGPSLFPRRADDVQAVREVTAAGMAGLGIKAHEGDTAARAGLLNAAQTGCRVYGGVVLNHYVGGINPAAVETSLKLGGRLVWLPTLSSRQHVEFYARQGIRFLGGKFRQDAGEGVAVLTEAGTIVPALGEVLELIDAYGAVLSTGHVSAGEGLAVAREYRRRRMAGQLVMGHPDLIINQATLAEQQEFADCGGWIEKCTLALHGEWGKMPVEEFVAGIRAIGVERCFLTTDAGGPDRGSSPDTLRRFVALALEQKLLSEQELQLLLVENPQRVVG